MGTKLLFTGLTVMLALTHYVPEAQIVGSVLMIIGTVLLWLDK